MAIEADDLEPKKPEPLLLGADLARFSIAELHARIAAMESEIERCRAAIGSKTKSREAAESVFKR